MGYYILVRLKISQEMVSDKYHERDFERINALANLTMLILLMPGKP